ncbi:MAG: DUF4380 domain-containing protein [Verrucomicrobia bacterium]|nr:DUF4380 domain-containing protein [Verrucomicrobiota bacterium]MCF7709232.1 DUF4380 domain-containing protein [Verrucomicrobiota bacterium]
MKPINIKLNLSYILAILLVAGLVDNISADAECKIKPIDYRGWENAFVLSNNSVEAVIVPAVGRIMQFRFKDGPTVFWENTELFGEPVNPESDTWRNFGGDKAWPAPQAEWPEVTPRAWPPPKGFDSMPMACRANGDMVVLESATDPDYGIRVIRKIRLRAIEPVMVVETTYKKVEGAPVEVGVWVVTQLCDPMRVYIPVPEKSVFEEGYNLQLGTLPAGFEKTGRLISLKRNAETAHKIGSDAGRLLWLGESTCLLMKSPRLPDADYPDNGSSAEVYTNPNPLEYIELELLGPLKKMQQGDEIKQQITYTLFHRENEDDDAEARRILGLSEKK